MTSVIRPQASCTRNRVETNQFKEVEKTGSQDQADEIQDQTRLSYTSAFNILTSNQSPQPTPPIFDKMDKSGTVYVCTTDGHEVPVQGYLLRAHRYVEPSAE